MSSISKAVFLAWFPRYRTKCWKRKMLSNNIEQIDRINLTELKAPGAKKGSPSPIDSRVDYSRERQPPLRSSKTFASDQPSVL